jgi:16S rRNA (cytosine1402-N4)-methyltransferase
MHLNMRNDHTPVLLDAVLQYLDPKEGNSYLDLTAGYGGHATAILERTHAPQQTTLVDRDQQAITALGSLETGGATLVHNDFLTASQTLQAQGKKFDMVLADLGLSSPHLNNASRGFAFGQDGPLDMRMDQSQTLSADTVVNTFSEDDLREIIRKYGEEPRAARVAHAIVANRPLKTTQELAEVIRSVMPRGSKTNPATKTFQSLRIAVNDELELLKASLPLWFDLLAPGGRIAVISFHSLEDRLVKQAFKERSGNGYDAELSLLTRRPVVADRTEIVFNPRSRSAKLRVAVKK